MERVDDTGFGGLKVIQRKGSGYGVDAVLLSAFAAGDTGAKGLRKKRPRRLRVADLGTGCGVAAFILHHKLGGARMTGYDIDPGAIDRAVRACAMNGLTEDIDFICLDIKEISAPDEYNAVITNPPYFRRTEGMSDGEKRDERHTARHETTADIADFASAASGMLKEGGSLYMVHRPERLADIFSGMRAAGIEPKEMQLVVPADGKASNIVLLHGVKGGGPGLKMLPGIAVRREDGSYTEELLSLYEREA